MSSTHTSAAPRVGGRRYVRASAGFTLLELLIALALILALGALLLPLGIARLHREDLESARDNLEASIQLARAQAQRRGMILGMSIEAAEGGGGGIALVTRRFEPENQSEGRSAESRQGSAAPPNPSDEELDRTDLPAGIIATVGPRAETSPSMSDDADGPRPDDKGSEGKTMNAASPASSGGGPAGLSDAPERATPFVIILPDGQVFALASLNLTGRDGRAASVSINRWTGEVTLTPVAPSDEESDETAELPTADRPEPGEPSP